MMPPSSSERIDEAVTMFQDGTELSDSDLVRSIVFGVGLLDRDYRNGLLLATAARKNITA